MLEGHTSSVNCLAILSSLNLIASGSADATVKLWRLHLGDEHVRSNLLQTIQISPRFFPLTLALHGIGTAGDIVLAIAGTKSIIQIYISSNSGPFELQATLPGHEGWVRSLSFTNEIPYGERDLLLASGSQDKYIRLWRISAEKRNASAERNEVTAIFEESLSNKRHRLKGVESIYMLTFEALLLGHEDWIHTVSWNLQAKKLQLLSASADNSVSIWEPDQNSGIWVCTTRLGEISAQKGSTTATGSTGGFWIGLWSSTGESIVSLGRTGSWRLWNYDREQDRWVQGVGTSGHTKAITDIAWSKDGAFLLSTGSDQTTRLHAEWLRQTTSSWHEIARPQIHGYDLNCIGCIGQTQFISGADEKLLRVFDEPQATAHLLNALSGIQIGSGQKLPEAANIPVLGLSNKAVDSTQPYEDQPNGQVDAEPLSSLPLTSNTLHTLPQLPPPEDQLARHTLWPEHEKLYGHGYEISAVAASYDGTVVATSCKASSLEHAVIRLYTTEDWREVKPALTAHSLTCTALAFSKDDRYLLSVGRDRQWVVFEREGARRESYLLKHANPKGHSRMILDACWAPLEAGGVFATAGRDKAVKLWKMADEGVDCTTVITNTTAITAVDLAPKLVDGQLLVARGAESGDVAVHTVELNSWAVQSTSVPSRS